MFGVGNAHATASLEIDANNGHNQTLSRLMTMKYTFEDFKPGYFGTFGPRHVTREEILAFAAEYDPQPMHLDEDAANKSMLKGLSGSGWHMCALMMRMMCDGYLNRTYSMGAPGVDSVRWLSPMRPGDDLALEVEVLEARPSQSRPDIGIVKVKSTISNASGEKRAEMIAPLMVLRRAAVPADQD